MPQNLQAVFFDVGNTLLFPDRTVILAPLYERSIVPTIEQWHAIERETKREFDAALERLGRADHSFWFMFYSRLLDELQVSDDLVRDALVAATRISANWGDVRPGSRDVLKRLGCRYRLGIISNADGKIDAVLTTNGLIDCFETITDSGIVGHEKPHPVIFETALRSLGVGAAESLYVGDVHSVDYMGATRAGMQAILFDVAGAYRDDSLPRVASLQELESWLMKPAKDSEELTRS